MTLQRDEAWAAVHDPITDAGTLAEVAHAYPEFGAVIERHPNSYEGLNDWLRESRAVATPAPAAASAPASVAAAVSVAEPRRRGGPPYRGRATGAWLWGAAFGGWALSVLGPMLLREQDTYYVGLSQVWFLTAAFGAGAAASIASAPAVGRRIGAALIMAVPFALLVILLMRDNAYLGGYAELSAILFFLGWAISRPIRGAGYAALPILPVIVIGASWLAAYGWMASWSAPAWGWTCMVVAALLTVGGAGFIVWLARVWSNGSERRRLQAVAPLPAGAVPAAGATNSLAIAAFICAFFFGVPAVVLGHVALSRIARTGEGGRGLAIAALVLGYIGIASGLILLVTSFSSLIALVSYGGYGY